MRMFQTTLNILNFWYYKRSIASAQYKNIFMLPSINICCQKLKFI